MKNVYIVFLLLICNILHSQQSPCPYLVQKPNWYINICRQDGWSISDVTGSELTITNDHVSISLSSVLVNTDIPIRQLFRRHFDINKIEVLMDSIVLYNNRQLYLNLIKQDSLITFSGILKMDHRYYVIKQIDSSNNTSIKDILDIFENISPNDEKGFENIQVKSRMENLFRKLIEKEISIDELLISAELIRSNDSELYEEYKRDSSNILKSVSILNEKIKAEFTKINLSENIISYNLLLREDKRLTDGIGFFGQYTIEYKSGYIYGKLDFAVLSKKPVLFSFQANCDFFKSMK